MSTYEGMLLVEPTVAAREWEKIVEEVERVAERNKAKVLSLTKWGEIRPSLEWQLGSHQVQAD